MRQTMMFVEVSEIIRAPRDRVFSVETDFENWPKIFPHVRSVREVSQKYGETLLELEDSAGGRVTIVQRTRRCEKIVEDLARGTIREKCTYTFEALPDGTRVTIELGAKVKGPYKLLSPLVKAYLRRRLLRLVLGPMKRAAEDFGSKDALQE
jgi:uncharacterized membrane protein